MTAPRIARRVLAGTTIWTAGRGPSLVCVHGGPGFDHTYLVEPLLPLARRFRLVFYDQLGSASRGRLTPARLVEQLRALLVALGGEDPPGLLAHSWGTYLALACLAHGRTPRLRGVLLVSPVGLARERFDRSQARQMRKFPKELRDRMREPDGLDLALVRDLTPYYLAPSNRGKVTLAVSHYDGSAAGRLLAGLGDYDFRGLCGSLPAPTHLVYGQEDAYRPRDTREIHACALVTTMPFAGHFPFAEQPQAFRSLAEAALR